jgi:hypothetical protein
MRQRSPGWGAFSNAAICVLTLIVAPHFSARQLSTGAGARLFAECCLRVAEHKPALGSIDGRAAHPDARCAGILGLRLGRQSLKPASIPAENTRTLCIRSRALYSSPIRSPLSNTKIFGVRFADGRRDRRPAWCATMVHDPQCRACRQSRQIQEKAQDYSGFGLKSQTPARKSAQLSRACGRMQIVQ